MDGKKQQTGSSFTSDLFGPKHNPNDSPSIFATMFSPPNKGVGSESWNTCEYEKKNGYANNQSWNAKTGSSEKNGVGGEGQSQVSTNKNSSSYYQDQKIEPFHYSSSIYYGGQDVYTPPQTAKNPVFATFSKDGEDDGSGHASRGNWWQGSLYY